MDSATTMKVIITGLHHIEITRFSQLASSSIIIFDHFVTFGEEVDLIWGSSWSLGKVLFLMNRYYSLAAVIFNNYGFFSSTVTNLVGSSTLSCDIFFQWQGWTGLASCMIAEGILMMRLYALYSLNKKILALMLCTFTIASAAAGWIMYSVLSGVTADALRIPGGRFCYPHGVSDHFYVFWIPMLGFECILCTLALIRGFQAFKSDGSLFRSGRQLVGLLIRDSVIYFLVICATYVTCLMVWLVAPSTLMEVPIGFSVAMSCVLANRLVLNVRAASREVEESKGNPEKGAKAEWQTSFCSPGCITQFEMDQLRTIQAERRLSDILEYYEQIDKSDLESLSDYEVPWKVL